MKIENLRDKPFLKIFFSFLISGGYLLLGFFLQGEYPSIGMVMRFFGVAGILMTFVFLVINISSWSNEIEGKIGEWFLIWFETANTLLIISAIAFSIRFFVVQPFVVNGSSMEPTYQNGEILIVNEFSYKIGKEPQRGEVIVFKFPKNPSEKYIKRIIGLPGETVIIKDKKLYLRQAGSQDIEEIKESYIPYDEQVTNTDQEWTLGKDEFFVVGDNRLPGGSSDSRMWGPLPRQNIIGKVWVVVWPFSEWRGVNLPSYPSL